MKKIFFLCALLLLGAMPSFAQMVVNAGKDYIPASKGNTVNVTAVAIPGGMPHDIDTSAENYHRTVITGSASSERKAAPAVVEVTVSAKPQDQSSEGRLKKDVVSATPKGILPAEKAQPKQVEVSTPAVKK